MKLVSFLQVAKKNAPYERDEMSCQLLFIDDIVRAIPQDVHRTSNQPYTGNFILNISDTSTIEFQNVRYMEFHVVEY